MNEIKTQFTTREGLYKLLPNSEYSRPNRVPFNSQGSNPVRVSFVNLNDQSGNGDRLCFNVGRELYFYIYKGVRKVPTRASPGPPAPWADAGSRAVTAGARVTVALTFEWAGNSTGVLLRTGGFWRAGWGRRPGRGCRVPSGRPRGRCLPSGRVRPAPPGSDTARERACGVPGRGGVAVCWLRRPRLPAALASRSG